MPGDDEDERAIETQRLVQELAEVRKRMQMRAEQPPLRNGSGAYRAVTPLPFLAAASTTTKAAAPEAKPRTSPPPAEADAVPEPKEEEPPPPTRRRPT